MQCSAHFKKTFRKIGRFFVLDMGNAVQESARKFIRNSILNENTVSAVIFDRHRCRAQSRCVLKHQKPSALSANNSKDKKHGFAILCQKNIQYTLVRGNINRIDVPYQKFGAIRITRTCVIRFTNAPSVCSLAENGERTGRKETEKMEERGKTHETRKC